MLAIGQKVVMVSSSEEVAQTLRKCKKKFRGRVVYINREHRWFTVEYKAIPCPIGLEKRRCQEMAEYVNREKLLKRLEHSPLFENPQGHAWIKFLKLGVIDLIEKQPAADVVEVVRCKDCIHCSKNTPDGWQWCEEHERGCLEDWDYCSCDAKMDGDKSYDQM